MIDKVVTTTPKQIVKAESLSKLLTGGSGESDDILVVMVRAFLAGMETQKTIDDIKG